MLTPFQSFLQCRLDVDLNGDVIIKQEWGGTIKTQCRLNVGQHCDFDNVKDVNKIFMRQ